MILHFVTKNRHKVQEVEELLSGLDIKVTPVPLEIREIQTAETNDIVRDKVLKAFRHVGRPVFVEHTGLYIGALGGFPGGLTQVFWDKLKADMFSSLLGRLDDPSVTAKTIIAYCDAKRIHIFDGSVDGRIAETPAGDRSFQWDCVFIPSGYSETFAELGNVKNQISMRKRAFDKFKKYLEKERL
ncbi:MULTISPECIES: non-canonical purine NTP pyrophosphatase [unclassified Thioalkalivibrio]|uniref:non-canonical purine NTP pyrophosphatase n=1 Tax=unclassified Thioalkalivibrio TaxID=2621013 RepID=UPI0009D9B620|nr:MULTISPECIES: non-canonical purine NTP pyrophosphatase [unclassified Thioalkalivibrio]